MRFLLAFRYCFLRNGGFVNLLVLAVCLLIPYVGPIVLLGYCAEVAVALERDPDLRRHPRFRFDRFIDYLSRGIWPFLIQLILVLPFIALMIGTYFLGITLGFVLIANRANKPLLFLALFTTIVGVEFLLQILMQSLAVPMSFHAKITGRFDLKGAFHFTWDFWKRVGWLALGTGIAYTIFSFFASMLGLLCCYVGVFPAAVVCELAAQHLMVQLYLIYLDRGGEPLPEYVPPPRDEDDGDSDETYGEDDDDDEYDRDERDRHDRD